MTVENDARGTCSSSGTYPTPMPASNGETARAPVSPGKPEASAPPAGTVDVFQATRHPLLPVPLLAEDAGRDPSTRLAEVLDRSVHYWIARSTLGLSPVTIGQAYADWALHLMISPGKRVQLGQKGVRKSVKLARHAVRQLLEPGGCQGRCIDPLPQDKRFTAPEWQQWPYDIIYQSFLFNQQWWHNAMTGVRGVSAHHEAIADFTTRQILDVFSPANFIWTNPTILAKTQAEAGQNLVRGWWNFLEDWERSTNNRPAAGVEAFEVGQNLAMTPGKVIYRNRLIELIQYSPSTTEVRPEPVLVVPAWIMKYYILDLEPDKSLVKHLVDEGFTVFMISWLNPDANDRDLTLDDYRRLGISSALDVIGKVVPGRKVHGTGYCLGGTLLAATAAAMARDEDNRFATLSFLASQVDFVDAGELTLFIDESQLQMLDSIMTEQGYLDAQQMAGAFQMIRSNDLIWSHVIHNYLMGERQSVSEMMAWNADATRMPYRMHSEYLRRFFLDNDLAEGRYDFDGRPVALGDLNVPVFAVATEIDHVSPWKSVYKLNVFLDTDITFLLASGGHNAGIVPDLKRAKPHYRVATRHEHDHYIDPEIWQQRTPVQAGSWWPAWSDWLAAQSGKLTEPPAIGASRAGIIAMADAPGTYVRRK